MLSLEGGQELRIHRDELGTAVREGEAYSLQIVPDREAALDREALARTLLNQILTDDDAGA